MLFTIIDVIGVAKSASDVNTVTIKSTNKEIVKRDVQLVDQNRMQVNLTLWGSDVSRVAFSFLKRCHAFKMFDLMPILNVWLFYSFCVPLCNLNLFYVKLM